MLFLQLITSWKKNSSSAANIVSCQQFHFDAIKRARDAASTSTGHEMKEGTNENHQLGYLGSTRHAHSRSQSGFGFSDLPKSAHSDYMKVWFGTGSGSIGFNSSLINIQRTGTTRCIFGFGSQYVFRFKSTHISKIDSIIRKEHQTWSFKINWKVNIVINRNKTK